MSPPYTVLVDGKNYTEFVIGVSNQMQHDELNTSSTLSIRADTAQQNAKLLGEFLTHCNRQSAIKVFIRGYYTNTLVMRMSGYVVSLNGANPYTGFTVTATRKNTQGGDSTNNPGESDGAVHEYKRVDELVKLIIKTKGYQVGKIDKFPQIFGQWYPGNRSVWSQLEALADSVGAKVTLRPPMFKVNSSGDITTQDVFKKTDQTGNDQLKLDTTKKLVVIGDAGVVKTDDYLDGIRDDIQEEGTLVLMPFIPPTVGTPYGRGNKDRKGRYSGNPLGVSYEDKAFNRNEPVNVKTPADLAAEQMQREKIDPGTMSIIDNAKKYYYRNVETNKIEQYVRIKDAHNEYRWVPVEVAIQTMKGEMFIDFQKARDKEGYLGESGFILTLNNGDLRYPYLRTKNITGFQYSAPPTPQDKAQSGPGMFSATGAMSKNFVTGKQKITPQESVADFAAKHPDMVKSVKFDGDTINVFYDPTALQVDGAGRLLPTQSSEDGKANGAIKTTPMTRKQFNALTNNQIIDAALKTRAAVYNRSEDDFMKKYRSKDFYAFQRQTIDSDEYNRRVKKALLHEQAINKYVETVDRNDPDKVFKLEEGKKLPPIAMGSENLAQFLNPAFDPIAYERQRIEAQNAGDTTPVPDLSVVIGGDGVAGAGGSSTTLADFQGKASPGSLYHFKPNTLISDSGTGAVMSGETFLSKEAQSFSLTIELDMAVEVVTGQLISCDNTYGPFEGSYVIDTISESLSPTSAVVSYQLTTQAVMTGRARAQNFTPPTAAANNLADPTAPLIANSNEPVPVGAPGMITATGSAKSVVDASKDGLTANWNKAVGKGLCSSWTRQTYEHAYGLSPGSLSGSLFSKEDAIGTGRLMRSKMNVQSYAAAGGPAGLRPGDILLVESGSGGSGHIGIYGGDGFVYENSWRNGSPPWRIKTPISRWDKPSGVVRQSDIDNYLRQTGRIK